MGLNGNEASPSSGVKILTVEKVLKTKTLDPLINLFYNNIKWPEIEPERSDAIEAVLKHLRSLMVKGTPGTKESYDERRLNPQIQKSIDNIEKRIICTSVKPTGFIAGAQLQRWCSRTSTHPRFPYAT